MPRIYVHDFFFSPFEIENNNGESDFYCSVNVYYNFSKEDPGDGWDNLEFFNISVGTPFGLAKYLKKCINQGIRAGIFFFPHLLIVDVYNEDKIMKFLKRELESIDGKSERELVLKAIRKFDWESEGLPNVYGQLFL